MQRYDPNEQLPSPYPDQFNEILNALSPTQPIISPHSPSVISFVPTPSGMHPSNQSNSSSPPQLTSLPDLFISDDYHHRFDGNDYSNNPPFEDLGTSLPTQDYRDNIRMNNYSTYPASNGSHSDIDEEKLMILAQPRVLFRARYESEVDRIKNRAQRYIRTEDGTPKYDHPTLKIPLKWRDPTRQFYIRVTLVTILTKKTPFHCIHPYKIDTLDNHALKDERNNSIYFRINPNDISSGEKSFLIGLTKKIQSELKSYGPLRPFDPNDNQHVQNLHDPKQLIHEYQLNKSQLIFTVVELNADKTIVTPFDQTSVETRIMIDNSETNCLDPVTERLNNHMRCIPQKGNWHGNEEIVIIMPHSIKKKEYTVWFDFGNDQRQTINGIQHIDTKTILFQTPSCPFLPGNDDIKVSIYVQENQMIPIAIDFYYVTPIKTIINLCPGCSEYGTNNSFNKKRAWTFDGAGGLVEDMSRLTLDQKSKQSSSSKTTEEINNSKFDKYLNQLKDALELFVRQNDPSRLFRRTRILLTKYSDNPSPLHDAIINGHTHIAHSLIEQIIDIPSPNRLLETADEHGQTPLLLAAKYNHQDLVQLIVKSRSDLIKQKDNKGNNLFHLLSRHQDEQVIPTIENLFKISSEEMRVLLNEENHQHQTPIGLAQSNSNHHISKLFIRFLNTEESPKS